MKALLFAVLSIMLPVYALAGEKGLVHKQSKYLVAETITRLEAVLRSKGVIIFARIDHSGEAGKVGLTMRPTQLLIFGNPKAGTPLMNASPSVAIDLPLKALAWEDSEGKVWLTYNSPEHLKQRHDLPEELMKHIAAIGALTDEALQ